MAKFTKAGRRAEQAMQVAALDTNPEIKKLLIQNIYAETDPIRDRSIYRLLIGVLAGVGVLALCFVFVLALLGRPSETVTDTAADGLTRVTKSHEPAPEVFLALGSAAIGALAGLLTPAPRQTERAPDPGAPPAPPPPLPGGAPAGSHDGGTEATTPGKPTSQSAPHPVETPDDKVTEGKPTGVSTDPAPSAKPVRRPDPEPLTKNAPDTI